MTVVLDAGAFIAVERTNRDVIALIKAERIAGRPPRTHGGVVGQVWRGGAGRQTPLAHLLAGVKIVPLDDQLGRMSGALLGRTQGSDVIDAALVTICGDGDLVLTTDPKDLLALAIAAGVHLEIVPI